MYDKTDLTEVMNYIKGKRVAIVGNSTSIFDSEFGREIDNHDVVIRFNKGFPTKTNSQGTKTDILFLACRLDKERVKRYHAKYTIKRLNIPYYNFHCDYTLTDEFIKEVSKDLKARSSTGVLAVDFALKSGAESIDMYGFDFFQNATYYNPYGYKTKHHGDSEKEKILKYQDEGKVKVWSKYVFTSKSKPVEVCNDKMEIVYTLDKNFIPLFNMSAESVLKYNPNAHITVVSAEPLDIDKKYDNFVIHPNRTFRHNGPNDKITDAAYYKLYFPRLPYDKIIYLDADTLCLKPLGDLWNSKCDYISIGESHMYGEKQAKEHGHTKYGIACVMVMNLKAMREDNFETKAFQPFDTSFLTHWQHEETIINHLFYDKLTFFSNRFNYCYNRKYKHPINSKDISILHFSGKEKKSMEMIYNSTIK